MQLVGLPLLIFIIWFGFSERDFDKISAFDSHALIMVLVGCLAAILSSSSAVTAWRTFSCLRELIPNAGILAAQTDSLEQERTELRDFGFEATVLRPSTSVKAARLLYSKSLPIWW